ncbi:hypothetical protein FDO65_06905 [Nakamurella flava]|uniref:Uncharacterized protein n=1 Tax=Nakamurella flava TaxID=2576308 RepID=A0A4U6QML4_9ACTN|nr:hypothetical protein [Nakamurella flava]TKV61326.1 hypothetical protein FDO65_06905 [Nakamurella flava]
MGIWKIWASRIFRGKRRRPGYLALTALSYVCEDQDVPVLYMCVSPPHVEREQRREFWKILSPRLTRVMQSCGKQIGGAYAANMWEVSAKIPGIHPHRNVLAFPVENVPADDPAWDRYREALRAAVMKEIRAALGEVTGEDRYVAPEAVLIKFLDRYDVSYFFKKNDPHSAENNPSWAWGDLLGIAAMDSDDPSVQMARARALQLYEEIAEVSDGIHLFSLSKGIQHLTGWISDFLMCREETDLWDIDAEIESEYLVAKSTSYDRYQESTREGLFNRVDAVLRGPLAWWLRRHREKMKEAFLRYFRSKDPMAEAEVPQTWDAEWPAGRYVDAMAHDADPWPVEEPEWDREQPRRTDDSWVPGAVDSIALARSMVRDAEQLKRRAADLRAESERMQDRLIHGRSDREDDWDRMTLLD